MAIKTSYILIQDFNREPCLTLNNGYKYQPVESESKEDSWVDYPRQYWQKESGLMPYVHPSLLPSQIAF